MPRKIEEGRTDVNFDLELDHADIISMLEDTGFTLPVSQVQPITVVYKSASGAKVQLKNVRPNDKIIFRFRVVGRGLLEDQLTAVVVVP